MLKHFLICKIIFSSLLTLASQEEKDSFEQAYKACYEFEKAKITGGYHPEIHLFLKSKFIKGFANNTPSTFKKKSFTAQINTSKGEDRYAQIQSLHLDIFAVFDGHGGSIVSDLASKELLQNIALKLKPYWDEHHVQEVIIQEFNKFDHKISQKSKKAGSTCVMLIRLGKYIYLVNLGDSKGILYENKEIIAETNSHSTTNESEINTLGKRFDNFELTKSYAPRVLSKDCITMVYSPYLTLKANFRVLESMATTRAFGHQYWPKDHLKSTPDILTFEMHEGSTYDFLLVSDGITDVCTNSQELTVFLEEKNPAKAIINFAEYRWNKPWNYVLDKKTYDPKGIEETYFIKDNKEYFIYQPDQRLDADDMTVLYGKLKF